MKLTKLLILPLIASLPTCGSKEAKYNTIVLASWGEYFSEDDIKKLETKTGYEIKLVEYASNEILYKEMKTNNYDIVIPSEYMVNKLISEGEIQKLKMNDYGIEKSDFLPSVSNAYNNYKLGRLWDYSIPLVVGDLRVHVNPKVSSKISHAVNDGTIDFKKLIDTENIKIGLQEDARNVTWLAMNYLYGSTIKPYDAVNPDLDKAKTALEEFFKNSNKFIFGDETIVPESWVSGNVDVIVGYNTDPNWTIESAYDYPEVDEGFGKKREYKSYKLKHNSNLWIDAITIVKDAKPGTKDVVKEIFNQYETLALANSYSPTIEAAHKNSLNQYSGQALENYLLSDQKDYYSLYTGNKKGDNEYNEKIAKLYSKYRS